MLEGELLTLMLGFCDELTDHGLDDANVAVEETPYCASSQRDPDVGGESDHDHAEHGPHTAKHQDRFATDAVRQAAPVHAHEGFGEGEGGDEETRVEGGILLVSDFESLDESPGIWKDGSESDWFGKANNGCGRESASSVKPIFGLLIQRQTYRGGRVVASGSRPGCEDVPALLGSCLLCLV